MSSYEEAYAYLERHVDGLKTNKTGDERQTDGEVFDKKTLAMLRLYAAGKLPANFLEVMSCPGGCVNGPCSLRK